MIRLGFGRPWAAALALCLCVFALGVGTASASHYRYGDISWEKDLTYTGTTDYKVTVTFHGGWRWSYPYAFDGLNHCPTSGFTATGSVGSGSCPPLLQAINVGQITPNKAVRYAASGSNSTLALTYNARVNTINQSLDLIYTDFSFDLYIPIASNPVTLTYTSGARISTLLEGNNDQNWQLTTTIDASPTGSTKSPKSVSLPLLYVTAGVPNQVFIPTVAFDNYVNKFRFSTTAESALVRAIPGSSTATTTDDMVLSTTTDGLINWTPPAGVFGPYAAQFMVSAWDTSVTPAVKKSEVPLDLIFQVQAPVVGAPGVSLTTPSSTVTFSPGVPLVFNLTSSMSPATGGYTATINHTPLPTTGTTSFTQPACTGLAPCVATVTWTPTLASTAQVMCFMATYMNTTSGNVLTSPGMTCVNIYPNPYPTTLLANPSNGVCGGPTTVSAKLTRTIDALPLPQRTIVFSWQDTGEVLCSALTNSSGIATCPFIPSQPTPGGRAYQATFTAVANELLQSSGSQSTAVVTGASATLDAPILTPLASVGMPLTATVKVNRVLVPSDGGIVAPAGTVVNMTATPGVGGASFDAATGQVAGTGGIANVTFSTTPTTTAAGTTFQLYARFEGDTCLAGNVQSATTSFGVFQRVKATVAPLTGLKASGPATFSGSLSNYPQGTGLAGKTLSLVWTGPAGGLPTTVTTNAVGTFSVPITFPVAGTYSVTATYVPVSPQINSVGAAVNEVATQSFSVALAATSLSALTGVPAVSMLNSNPLTVSTTLTRTDATSGPIAGSTVTFTLTRVTAPVVTVNRAAVTLADGSATATFTAAELAVVGDYTLQASVGATTALSAATSPLAAFTASNLPLTDMTIAPITGVVGSAFTLTAHLFATGTNAPIANQTVTFSLNGGTLATAVTNVNGDAVASATYNAVLTAGTYRADYAGQSGTWTPTAATNSINISLGQSTLATPTITPAAGVVVGGAVTVSTTLGRTDAAAIPANQVIVFTLTQPGGNNLIQTANTAAGGAASVTFSGLTARGLNSVSASFAGSSQVTAVTSASSTFPAYDKTQFTAVSAPFGLVGAAIPVSATLSVTPSGGPIAGQLITFTFTGTGAPSPVTATTGANGTATASVTAATAGSFPFTASVSTANAFLTTGAGVVPPPGTITSASSTLTVANASTSLTALTAPATAIVGNSALVTVTLLRTSAPAGPLAGQTVVFNLGGAASAQVSAVTDGSGVATASFPLTARGSYTVGTVFAGGNGYNGAASNAADILAYQSAQLTASSVSAFVGVATPVTATLTAQPGDAPISGETVTFDFGGVIPPQSASTVNGVATITATFPNTGTVPYTVSFLDAFYTNHAGALPPVAETASGTATVTVVTTALSPVDVVSSTLVGQTLAVTTTLTRVTAPSGALPGQPVVFTLTAPGGAISTLTGTTNGSGVATASFPALTLRGSYQVTAAFAGGAGFASATSSAATVTAYQRTQLTLGAVTGAAGGSQTVSATLTAAPSGAAVSGQAITFSFSGGVSSQTANTDASGVATVTVSFPSAGTFTATASFLNAAGSFTDHTGAIPPVAETATATATIAAATTQLSALVLPATKLVGDSLVVTTTLTRVSAPAGVVNGVPVVFAMSGAESATVTANTDANGIASATFSLTTRGAHTVLASFAGTASLNATSSNSATVTVYQRTLLSLGAVTATAGAPATISATLNVAPQNTELSGELVTFDFGGVIPAQSATTVNGVATISVTFPSATTVSYSASFLDAAAFYADHTGTIPPVAESVSGSAIIASAATSLSPVSVASGTLIGQTLSASTVLTRTAAPSGVVVGQPVIFTLTGPGGITSTATGTTGAGGLANVSFPALTVPGVYQVTAAFAGDASLQPSSSNPASVTAYQRTQLTLGAIAGAAGSSQTLSATLTAIPGATAIAGQTIAFSFGGVIAPQTATTNASGVATVTVSFPNAGTFTTTASFLNAAGFFTDQAGSMPPAAETAIDTATITAATTALSALVAPANRLVSDALTVTTTLSRVDAPAGTVAGVPVLFTLSGAESATQTATTDSNGVAAVTFPALSARGAHTVVASFAGSSSLKAATSNAAAITVYQRTQLAVGSFSGTAGADQTLSATLTTVPGGTPVAGESIAFAFGGAIGPQTATTDATGTATITVDFPNAGSFTATASFLDGSGFFADHTGAYPVQAESASATATVVAAATTLASLSAPATSLVGNAVTASTILTRTAAPAGAVSGASVVFTLNGPSTSVSQTVTTDASGAASASFPVSARGAYTVTASFAGTAALTPSTSNTAAFTAYQRTQLTFGSVTAAAHADVTMTATLNDLPQTGGLSGQAVTFDFGGVLPPQTVNTVNGVASVSVQFAQSGAFPVTASFINAADNFTDHNGAVPPVAESASATVTISDPTPPVITADVTGTQGANGWYTGDVSIVWHVTDGESAIASQTGCGPVTVNSDGASFAFTCDATSAGGPSSKTVSFKRDASAPVITVPSNVAVNATSPAGANVTFAAVTFDDPTSGVTSQSCSKGSGDLFPLGPTTVSCTATNGAGETATASFTVTVTNNPPVATNDAFTTNEDTAVSGNVLTNDTDVEHNTLTAALMATTAHGALSLAPNGAFTYTPAANYNGSDSFTYRVNDGIVDGNVATVSITVNAVNDAPVAAGQSVSTNEDTAKAIALVATDVDGDTLTYSVVTGPAHGTLSGSGAALTYTPAANFNGTDSFTFRANDGQANSNTAAVSITIIAVNDAPVAVGDAATTNANTSVSGNVLSNDSDVEGSALTAVLVAGPAHGTVTLNANGTFTYLPAADYFGADSFTYQANDGTTNGNTATVSLTVLSVDQVAANVSAVVTAIDPGLQNDVAKITSGNPKNNCKDAVKLQDQISKDKKYTAAQKAAMIEAIASLAQSIGC